jgi:hypothetical protein
VPYGIREQFLDSPGFGIVNIAELRALLRAAFATFGRPMLARAAAVTCGVGLLGSVLFGRQGMRARDAVGWMDASLVVRAAVWVAWTMLAAPAVSAGVRAPGTVVLRSLRDRATAWLVLFGALATLAQAPFALLWFGGAGPSRALFATVLAVSMQMALAARGAWALLALVELLAAIVAPSLGALLGVVLLPFAIRAAWTRSDASPSVHLTDLVRPHSALGAMLKTTLLGLVRTERARLGAALGVLGAGAAFLGLSLRNDPPEGSSTPRAMIVFTLPAAAAAGAIATPVVRCIRSLEWVLRAARGRKGLPGLAAILTCTLLVALPVALVSPAAALWSSAITAVIVGWARATDRSHPHDGARYAVGVVVVAAVALGSVSVAWAWGGP